MDGKVDLYDAIGIAKHLLNNHIIQSRLGLKFPVGFIAQYCKMWYNNKKNKANDVLTLLVHRHFKSGNTRKRDIIIFIAYSHSIIGY